MRVVLKPELDHVRVDLFPFVGSLGFCAGLEDGGEGVGIGLHP